MESQRGYLALLTLPPESRPSEPLPFAALRASAAASGARLLAIAREADAAAPSARLRTTDGFLVEPWVVLLQAIQHGIEHRRQAAGMLRSLGRTPPGLDGWAFGEARRALVPLSG